MRDMALSVFPHKAEGPTEEQLMKVMGYSYAWWSEIVSKLENDLAQVELEWKFYSKQSGWTCLARNKKRTIFYMFPNEGFFTILFVYGEKAAADAEASGLPEYVIERIKEATAHIEGKSFFLEIRAPEEVPIIHKLASMKLKS
jgi:hypothetical protein